VTEKGGANVRMRGRIPRIIWLLAAIVGSTATYAAAGLAGVVPWMTDPGSTASSGVWLLLAAVVLLSGVRRIRAAEYATSRRNAHRVRAIAAVEVDGVEGELVDVSTGGAAVRLPKGVGARAGIVEFTLPGAEQPIKVRIAPLARQSRGSRWWDYVSLQVQSGDWAAHHALSMWIFHTPDDAIPGLPAGTPAVAIC
jgi:cellulose synthase (UDP-forming)